MWGKFRLTLLFFIATLIDVAKGFALWRNDRSIPPDLPATRLEQPSAVSLETEQQQPLPMIQQQQQPDNNHHDRAQIDNMMNMQGASLVIAAISVLLQALQTRATLPAALLGSVGIFLVLLEMAFLALLVSVYLRRHYHKASRVMEHVAVFYFAVALVLAIWMTLHPPLQQMSVALFIIGFTIVILANRSLRDW